MKRARAVGLGIMGLIGVVALAVVISYVATCSRIATTPARVVNRLVNEDNVISRYEWYYDAYHKCLAYNQQLVNAQGTLKGFVEAMDTKSWSDKQERARLSSVVLGIRNQRSGLVEQYNSNSGKLTQNLFKGWSLAYRLAVVEDVTVEVEE